MQAALDLAGAGIKVYLVEGKPGVGGVMAQLDKTFPTNDCAMCTMAPRLADLSRHKDIELMTLAGVERIEGGPGDFRVTVRKRPRYVDEAKCTGCGTCVASCPVRYRVQPVPEERRKGVDLAPEVRREVAEIVGRWKGREGPLMPVLQEVNARFNYFPEEVMRFIAQEMGYPLSHLYRIATFYGAFSLAPRGKYTVNVCLGTTCYVRGSERLMERFGTTLGIAVDETTRDKLFTLKAVRCIGCCGLAPAVAVGTEVHGKLAVKDVPKIVERYRDGEAA
jgi:NADH:ubiquinone oxidoreductase subunit E/NAD-dependent dihydropyrimidine dehydrogenase PreA subunit